METATKSKPIPIYKGKGLLGMATEFMENPALFCHEVEPQVGDFFEIKIPTRRVLVTFRPSIMRHVLQSNAKNYRKSPTYKHLRLLLGNGLVTSEGEFWKKQRKMAQPAFHKKYLQSLFESMADVTNSYIADLKRRTEGGKQVDMAHEMMQVTADVVMKTLFTTSNNLDKERMYNSMEFLQQMVLRRVYKPYMTPWYYLNGDQWNFNRKKKWLDNLINGLIVDRRAMQDNRPPDLLTMLLETVDEETGETMPDGQLLDELKTIYIAGHETSANGLCWTLYLLAQHPEIIEKLREEEKRVLDGRRPAFEDLMQMQYTKQVIEEGMRLYPPAYTISRCANEDDEVDGFHIPKDMIVYMSIYALHRSPQYWDKPDEFNPDRFSLEQVREREKLTYMPFGAGARMCIGNNFAMMEMQLLLSQLLRNFDFELLKDQVIDIEPLVTLKPRYGIQMITKPRM